MNMMKKIFLAIMFLMPTIGVEASEPKLYEMPRTQVFPLKNSETGGQYELYIKLPEGYADNNNKKYSVIYLTDAVMHIELFSAVTAVLFKNTILVGISWQKDINEKLQREHGEHVSRRRDYTIKKSNNSIKQAKYQYGQAKNHLEFIRNDVINHVEKTYQTIPGNRTYFGYSLGGLFGAYILMTQPDTFKNYILGSPDFRNNIPILSELASNTMSKHKALNANVFIAYGSSEKKLGINAEEFITLLKNKNDETLSLKNLVIEGDHETAFPMTGIRSITWLSGLTGNKE
jgi:predicted alpha/beta superfamily hydrolase